MRMIGDIVREALATAPIQILPECMLGARLVNGRGSKGRKKGHEAYTRVEFATTEMTPDDLLWFSGQLGQSDSRKPKYVGIIVWVPTTDYERPEPADAVRLSVEEPGVPLREK